ncbi:MAG TPA: extracellular solute-binding protein [Bacillales bacterium]|nr:extracellular solute-binding protein [Bacillales bacterium]
MRRKRFMAILGACVVAGGLLSACGSSGDSQSSSANTTDSSSAQSGTEAKQIKITFWNAYSATDGEKKTIVHKVIPAFEKANPNIKVQNVTLPYDKMKSKLLTSVAGGELPDVARLDIIWVAQLAKLGSLVPENDLSGFSDLSKKVFKGPLSTSLYNGKYYGLPLDTNTKVLFSNTKLLAKHGISQPPKTMDEFIADIKKITSGSGKNKVYGYILPGTSPWQLVPWISSFGGSILSPDGKKAEGYLNGPKSVKAVSTLVNLFKQGYITGLLPGANGDIDGLGNGQYGMVDEGPWDVPVMAKTYPDVKYKLSPFPAGPGGSKEVVGGEDISVFKTDDAHQKAAWKFEKFMMQPKVQGWMQSVGQMSTLKDLPASASKGADYFKVFREQLKTSVARPVTPQFDEVKKAIENAVASAAQGKMSVKAALDQAAKQIDAVLQQN